MSAVPGGLGEIPVIAADMGADPVTVTVLQLGRMFLGIAVLPGLIYRLSNRKRNGKREGKERDGQKPGAPVSIPKCILTFSCAAAAGIVGNITRVPGGALVFSLIAVLILNLAFNAAEIPGAAKKVAQVANGCYIGSLVSFADILFLPQVIVPMLILLALYTAYCFFNGYLLHRLFKFEIKAAFLISTPAGASDMALIASDIGVHNPQVFVMHIVRLIMVMILFPQVVHLLATVILG